jgi:iron complex outermembrane receptor protein
VDYDSANYVAGERTARTTASGGETMIQAVYAQLGWQVGNAWDLAFGGRYEAWQSADGFYYDYAHDNLQDHPDRSENRFSPKFSVGFRPGDLWRVRYSLAKAYRFPIVEELFQNERRTLGTSIANANLEPEDGSHQNFMIQRGEGDGYVRLNLFEDDIDDVIFNQTAVIDNRTISTFLPVDEVLTRGVELIFNRANIAQKIDLRVNAAYIDSRIERDSANPALEGNVFPRMPKWRANVLVTYHAGSRWDVGGGIRYASNSFGDLDNSDTVHGVYGAQDGYTQLNFKAGFAVGDKTRISLGIDNLTNEIAFVHHPWPGRTFFLEAAVNP